MRRHSEASSAGSTKRQASRLGHSFRGAFAGPDVSLDDADGSGARSRGRVSILALALTVCASIILLVASSAVAGRSVVGSISGASSGTQGGQFNTPRGLAVNQNGTGGASVGDLYVADSSNHRIQQFKSDGTFIRTWGFDVVTGGGTEFEVCTVATECKQGVSGNAAGQMNSPRGVAINQSTGQVFVSVNGNRRIDIYSAEGTFEGAFGWGVDTGTAAFEFCTIASTCQAPNTTGTSGGQLGSEAFNIAVNPVNGNVVVPDRNNQRVQEFSIAGSPATGASFIRTFGWDVDATGGSGQLETCTSSAVGACKFGVSGSGGGQLSSPVSVAVDSGGAIYTAEVGNLRVQRFNPAVTNAITVNPGVLGGAVEQIQSPTDVYVNSANDHLFVVKGVVDSEDVDGDGNTTEVVERRIYELDSGSNLVDTHSVRAGLPTLNGLAVQNSSRRIYVSASNRVFMLDNQTPPTATIDPVTGVGATTVTFNGHVNPTGFATNYRFEYSTDGFVTSKRFPLAEVDAGPVGTNNAVSQGASGLEPSTTYEVRLVATKTFGGGVATTAPISFTTAASTPGVASIAAYTIAAGTVRLVGFVDPNHQSTTYQFQYGPDDCSASPCTAVPDAAVSVGSGTGSTYVSTQVSDLTPGQTYHFRLLATNATGTAEGADSTFEVALTPPPSSSSCPNAALRSGLSAPLPNCRAYEMVSPVEKANIDIGQLFYRESFSREGTFPTPSKPLPPFANNITSLGPMAVSADGDQTAFLSFGAFAGSPYSGGSTFLVIVPGIFYMAERNQVAQRWETVPLLNKRVSNRPPTLGPAAFGDDLMNGFVSSTSGVEMSSAEAGCDASTAISCAYQRNDDGSMTLVSPNGGPPNAATVTVNPSGETAAFESTVVLTTDPGVPAFGSKAYAWRDDTVSLVSKLPDGTPVNGAIGSAVMGSQFGLSQGSEMHAISEDGDQVFFSTNPVSFGSPPVSTNVYRRDLGGGTILASPSKRSVPDPLGPKAKIYFDATPDQSASGPAAVFFASAEKLTDDATTGPTGAGNDLYRYEINTDTLTDISVDTNDANGAQVISVIGASHDGKRVYYVAKGQIIAGKGVAGGNNVYLWTDDGTPSGTNRFIATLGAGDAAIWDVSRGGSSGFSHNQIQAAKSARVSDDGTRLLLESQQSLTGYDSNGLTEVFLFDAMARGGEGHLACISCRPDGLPSTHGAMVPRTSAGNQVGGEPSRALSADGRRAFFETRDSLLPTDANGKMDVYQWQEGELSLISPGLGEFDTYFHGASASGDDVFILTRDQLAPQDPDDLYDVYDARVNGGFPLAAADAPCTGEDCKAVATPQPETAAPGSATLAGARNESSSRKAPRRCRANQRQVKRKGKVRCVKRKQALRSKQSRNSSTRNGG